MHAIYAPNSSDLIRDDYCMVENAILYPCVTLDMLANDLELYSNGSVTIYFINENYIVYNTFSFSFAHVKGVELKQWKNETKVTILCMGDLSFSYTDVSYLTIQWIKFDQCGKSNSVITINKAENYTQIITIANATFTRSRLNSIRILCDVNQLLIINCLFDSGIKLAFLSTCLM